MNYCIFIEMVVMINGEKGAQNNDEEQEQYKMILKWRNILAFIFLHVTSIWAFIQPPLELSTYVFQAVMIIAIGFGTTVGMLILQPS
jgi:hypothetical protein